MRSIPSAIFAVTIVGVKMCLGHSPWKIDTLVSLGVIVTVLTTSVVASLLWPKRAAVKLAPPPP